MENYWKSSLRVFDKPKRKNHFQPNITQSFACLSRYFYKESDQVNDSNVFLPNNFLSMVNLKQYI